MKAPPTVLLLREVWRHHPAPADRRHVNGRMRDWRPHHIGTALRLGWLTREVLPIHGGGHVVEYRLTDKGLERLRGDGVKA